jgi:dolichol-phosphate mannosyltransferase
VLPGANARLAIPEIAPQFGRFALVGAAGFGVNLALFSALVAAGVPPAVAAVLAFAAAVANNWFWNARWTFAGSAVSRRRSGVRFTVVALCGLAVDLLVLHALVRAGVPPVAGQVAGVAVATPLTYVGNRRWTFRAP